MVKYLTSPFIDEFLEKTTNNRYFALPGLRGIGKTTLLYQTYEYLFKSKNLNPNQILFIHVKI